MAQPPIFIVSLQASERRAVIGPALERLGLTYAFVDGIEGAKLSEQAFAALYDGAKARRLLGRDLSRGEVGASATHREIYRRMIAQGIPRAIVLEDDATVGPAFAAFVRDANSVPPQAGVVLLYAANGLILRQPSFTVAGTACHRAATRLTHAVGYYVSLAAARTLVDHTPKIFWTPDWPVDRWKIPFYVTVPFLVGHGDFVSQVDATRVASRKQQNKLKRRPKFLTLRYYDRALVGAATAIRPGLFIDLKTVAGGASRHPPAGSAST